MSQVDRIKSFALNIFNFFYKFDELKLKFIKVCIYSKKNNHARD